MLVLCRRQYQDPLIHSCRDFQSELTAAEQESHRVHQLSVITCFKLPLLFTPLIISNPWHQTKNNPRVHRAISILKGIQRETKALDIKSKSAAISVFIFTYVPYNIMRINLMLAVNLTAKTLIKGEISLQVIHLNSYVDMSLSLHFDKKTDHIFISGVYSMRTLTSLPVKITVLPTLRKK